jgi:hypothetical protein
MEAALSNHMWNIAELVKLLEERSILFGIDNAA